MDDETRHEEFIARINAYGRDAFYSYVKDAAERGSFLDPVDPAYDAREAYELDDPKSPGFHDRYADSFDCRLCGEDHT